MHACPHLKILLISYGTLLWEITLKELTKLNLKM